MSEVLYRVVNDKPKPPWPESDQSYPIDTTVSLVDGCQPGDEGDYYEVYKVVVRYERPNGDIKVETLRRYSMYLAEASARDVIKKYHPLNQGWEVS